MSVAGPGSFSAASRLTRAAMALALATRSGTPAWAAFRASAKIAASETGCLAQTKTWAEEALVCLRQVRRFTQHYIGQVAQTLTQAGCGAHKVMPLARAT